MSKPEQVGWCDKSGEILSMTGRAKWLRMNVNLRATAERFNEPLIRLTDHERLQAEAERLQADNEAAIADLQTENQRLLSAGQALEADYSSYRREVEHKHEAARAADKARIAELTEALTECAASLAWNCFGECRAVHDGPIMPAAGALDMARAALAQQGKEGET